MLERAFSRDKSRVRADGSDRCRCSDGESSVRGIAYEMISPEWWVEPEPEYTSKGRRPIVGWEIHKPQVANGRLDWCFLPGSATGSRVRVGGWVHVSGGDGVARAFCAEG